MGDGTTRGPEHQGIGSKLRNMAAALGLVAGGGAIASMDASQQREPTNPTPITAPSTRPEAPVLNPTEQAIRKEVNTPPTPPELTTDHILNRAPLPQSPVQTKK